MEPTTSRSTLQAARIFASGGETGRLLAAMDWTKNPLGPVEQWPASLRTSLRLCLTSRHAMIIWWGQDLTVFYNDAYSPTLSGRHPSVLGKPGQQVWPEIWPVIGPMLHGVLETGQATWSDDQLLFLERNGYPEETYHSFSYSPIEDETGAVVGVFTAVTETTTRVLAERRARFARDVAALLVSAHTTEDVVAQAATALAQNPRDVPCSLFYRVDATHHRATLLEAVGITPGGKHALAEIDLQDQQAPWPFVQVMETAEMQLVPHLHWEPHEVQCEAALIPHTALVLPIIEPGQSHPSLIWIAGLSPQRPVDGEYLGFFDLLSRHLATALSAAHAYEAERKRAEALAEIDRAKTTFFSNVSHEFRTPLTLMLSPLADLLNAEAAPLLPAQREYLEVMQRNGMRLMKLVNTVAKTVRISALVAL